MPNFIPTPAYPDMMPVDISFVFADERPAGKHGFLQRNGDHFCFEDGTKVKFWGVCLSGSANFPEHDYARQCARRLAQAGVNLVRMHWMDSEFNTPNIFAFRKGKRVETTRKLDPESLDRMDYLVSCLKEQGIYIYLDNMTFRKFKSGDGVPHADELDNAAKPYTLFDPWLITLQKEYMTQLWTHLNPYTGLAYKDEPAVVLTEITNENDLLGNMGRLKSPYYDQEYRHLLRDWLNAHGKTYDWENCELWKFDENLVDFKMDVTLSYYTRMVGHLRSLGVRVPITGNTWYHNSIANVLAQKDMDYTDAHHYIWDHRWGQTKKFWYNDPITRYPSVCYNLAKMRTATQPFVVSEWNMCWPNSYRAEGPIYYAALSALQDWDGIGIFDYTQGRDPNKIGVLGSEMSTDYLAGYPFEAGLMSVWNDPAIFGLFYHGAMLLRRGDLSPAKKIVGIRPSTLGHMKDEAEKTGLEVHQMRVVLNEEDEKACDEIIADSDKIEWEDPNIIVSDNGQMRRYLDKKVGVIDTPRTKIVYGTLCKLAWGGDKPYGAVTCGDGFKVTCTDDFAVIAMSSLSDAPIEKSDNILLSAIGQAMNSGAVFTGEECIENGHAPILSKVIHAKISIRTDRTDLKVWGVNPEGYYVGKLPAVFEDGWMTFTIGDTLPAIYYLIVAE